MVIFDDNTCELNAWCTCAILGTLVSGRWFPCPRLVPTSSATSFPIGTPTPLASAIAATLSLWFGGRRTGSFTRRCGSWWWCSFMFKRAFVAPLAVTLFVKPAWDLWPVLPVGGPRWASSTPWGVKGTSGAWPTASRGVRSFSGFLMLVLAFATMFACSMFSVLKTNTASPISATRTFPWTLSDTWITDIARGSCAVPHVVRPGNTITIELQAFSCEQITDGLCKKWIATLIRSLGWSVINIKIIGHSPRLAKLPNEKILQCVFIWYTFHTCNDRIPILQEWFEIIRM